MPKLVEKIEEVLGNKLEDELREQVEKQIEEAVETRVKARESEVMVEAREEASKEYEDEIKEYEEVMLEEIKKFCEQYDEKQKGELKTFKEELVGRLSDFLEVKFKEAIPEELLEAQAKLAIFEPIVTGIQKLYEENFLRVDSEQYKVFEDAKGKIEEMREERSKMIEKSISLEKQLRDQKKEQIIRKVTTELTERQSQRFTKLAEAFDTDELSKKWQDLVEMVLEHDVKKTDTPAEDKKSGTTDLEKGTPITEEDETPASKGEERWMGAYVKEDRRVRGEPTEPEKEGE